MNIYDSLDYMKKRQNLVFVGPTGCGKSGLATSYLVRALDAGHTAYFVSFPDLIDRLYKSLAAHREDRLIKTLAAHDCMVIDELGYVDVEPAQVGLFFRLMTARHRLKTTIVTSNLGFQEWGSFLKNDRLTAALIDRLTENSHVINMKNCISLRPKEPDAKPSSRKKAPGPDPAETPEQT
jgi:DNA replication protein DnaC